MGPHLVLPLTVCHVGQVYSSVVFLSLSRTHSLSHTHYRMRYTLRQVSALEHDAAAVRAVAVEGLAKLLINTRLQASHGALEAEVLNPTP